MLTHLAHVSLISFPLATAARVAMTNPSARVPAAAPVAIPPKRSMANEQPAEEAAAPKRFRPQTERLQNLRLQATSRALTIFLGEEVAKVLRRFCIPA